ncbi:MAG: insulinase family protein [Thermodesulfobacteriota bacterium]|nr:insulinase family protein [Thermodesulfobacteriota bacterium]
MIKKLSAPSIIKVLLCTALIVVLFSCALVNQNVQSIAKSSVENTDAFVKWPHEKSDLLPDPDIIFGKLPNGFRYVLMENHRPKDRVGMHLDVQAGSLHESDNQQGLAHFLEHMLFNGSTNFKPGELVKYFQSIGMQFGADANAHTGFNETVYDILLPQGDRKNLKKGLTVIKDYAEGALLLPSEIDSERRVVLAEKRTRDSASYRTYVSTLNFEFPHAKISKRLPIGKEEILKKTDHKRLKAFYDTWYRPEKMILVMVGDFDTQEAISLIKENFSSLSSRAPAMREPDFGKINHLGIKPFYHLEKEAGNTTTSIEVVEKVSKKPDSFAFQRGRLIENMANRIVRDRLDARVRKAGTPFTSASIRSGYFLNQMKYAEITAECGPENWKRSLSLIEQILRKALKFGFTKSELDRVKKDYLSELDNAVKKASTRNSRHLARKILWNLNADRVFLSPEQKKELFTPLINALTLQNTHDAFKEIWAPEHRLLLVTGNAELTGTDKDPPSQILGAYYKSKKVQVSRPAEKKTVTFPYLQEPGKEGSIILTKKIPDLGIVQVDFKNGVRLNLKKTNFKANQVLINLAFGSGRTSEPLKKPGLAALSTKVINVSGLGALDKDGLERAMAGKNTDVFFDFEEDRFFFKGETVTQEVPLLFQLLYAHMVDPGFREDAYTLSMERFSQEYLELSGSINGAMVLSGNRFLAGGDSRFGLPSYEEFKQLTLEHVRSWIEASLKTDTMEVSVVGDFDMDSVIKLAAKYLGTLSLHTEIYKSSEPRWPEFPVGLFRKISVVTKIPKGMVIVAYPTEDLWNISRTRRLSVLADIVSDRLREQIREKLGSAYATFAFNRPSRAYPEYGVFQAGVYINPEEASMLVNKVKKIVSGLAADGATQDELRRALFPTLTSIKEMMRKNSYWLNTVLTGSKKHPQQLDWSRTIMKDYASITKEEVSNIAKKYLDNGKAAIIIVKPK